MDLPWLEIPLERSLSMTQNKEKIWLSSPHLGTNELKYVQEAFDSNWIAPVGPHLDQFERMLCQVTGLNTR